MRINQNLYDIDQNFGNDINLSALNDLNTVIGVQRSQQRILRRLLTAVNGYIWEVGYGAGLQQDIGEPISPDLFDKIKSLILSNIFLEDSVSQNPQPVISLQTIQDGLFCQINYTENPSRNPIVLTFSVSL